MSRPVLERIVFGEGLDLVVFQIGARHDAEFVARPEERDRDHQGAGELECVVLGEGKILLHLEAPSSERANPARWLRQCPTLVAITAKGIAQAAAAC
ncbi:hypothetical protein AGR4C_pc30023 [Agrobacterium tumefaciens str. Kerr 14]|uniref:Uncharacterized protein n=1 Tax=Agrobacterium tumefaciens str. Kerr 14 TaxID=1183424 RepID=A0A1S7SFU0_AGRTU|nr:hypothetical protein AGR4C_pc30023 [Agrobacterium tumefaciens str. Kerr 14]